MAALPQALTTPLAPLPESREHSIVDQVIRATTNAENETTGSDTAEDAAGLSQGTETQAESSYSEEGTVAEAGSASSHREPAAASSSVHSLTDKELTRKAEQLLLGRINAGDKPAIFHLAQLYFEMKEYEKSKRYLEMCETSDLQAIYQLAVLYFDGLGTASDAKKGLELMREVATSDVAQYKRLRHSAQFNVGRAYYQGFGVRSNPQEAERWWILAADDGNPDASIQAQTSLGMFYCRPETYEPKKAFFWHSEACGNGGLESQGALGLMYMDGVGIKKNVESAFECLSEASERGNVYAMGHLVAFYYNNKFHTKCVDLAARVSQLENSKEISEETDCQEHFIRRGICLACFYYGRCLTKGYATKVDPVFAQEYYKKACIMDKPTCLNLQALATQGRI